MAIVLTINATFDGEVFRPTTPVDLVANETYQITIAEQDKPLENPTGETAWDVLDRFTGSIEGPGDLSTELDHYLYGTPKRHHEDA